MKKNLLKISLHFVFFLFTYSCNTIVSKKTIEDEAVVLPFVKNSANECYFLDEFMPIPDNLVTGRSGSVSLRYYNYSSAKHKDWPPRRVVLSFYSTDNQCWSLFEEFYVKD